MKRGSLLFAAVLLSLAVTALAAGQSMTVRAREVQLRSTPSFTGKLTAKLLYGQSVSVLEENGPWLKVSAAGDTGWLHQGALSSRPLNLASGGADASAKASDREVTMAGKGFNAQVEQAYRRNHPEGYAQMEEMLKLNYSPKELSDFLAAGKLQPRQGAAQ